METRRIGEEEEGDEEDEIHTRRGYAGEDLDSGTT